MRICDDFLKRRIVLSLVTSEKEKELVIAGEKKAIAEAMSLRKINGNEIQGTDGGTDFKWDQELLSYHNKNYMG